MREALEKNIKMVITDLDGTLLNSANSVSDIDLNTLNRLGDLQIKRVIATGRSYFSLQRVIPDDFPVDYLISSSGAGIFDWHSKQIIHQESIPPMAVTGLAAEFINRQLDFMIQKPLPDNHRFYYYQSGNGNPDFYRRITHYDGYASSIEPHAIDGLSASLLIVITPPGIDIYAELQEEFPEFNVVRTTSPLDHESMWIEFFPLTVSKSLAAQYLCRRIGCAPINVMSVGNDYNDIDLLQWSPVSYVVANAPASIRNVFRTVASHENSGFTEAVELSLNNRNN